MSGEGSLFDVPPAAIGRFRVLHQVGAGTSGPVFRAVHPETSVPLAIKLFTLTLTPERASAVAADLEALVGAMPLSDGTCELIDAGMHGSAPFLVTGFAPGDSLDVALKQFGPAPLPDLIPRLRTLGRALDAAAARQVFHGALHPRDVLVSESSTMLTGPGAWPILVRCGERLPTRRPYRAPELADSAITAAGDRFALAALAYEWMTGRRAPSTFVAGDMVSMPGVDTDALGLVFARALHADPGERHLSCEAFVDELEDVEVEEALAAPASEPSKADLRPRRRNRSAARTPGAMLPLEVFPPEQAHEVSGPSGPAATSAAGGDTPADEPMDEPAMRPAAAARLAPPVIDDREAPLPLATPVARPLAPPASLPPASATSVPPGADDYQPSPAPVSVSSGGARLFAGLLLGALVGIGAGYAMWGLKLGAPWLATVPPSGPAAVAGPGSAPQDSAANAPTGSDRSAPLPSAGSVPPSATAVPETSPSVSSPRPAPAEPTTGNLLVRSTPAGATVFVDDQRRGVTPLTLQNVDLGTRRVRILRDGFAAEERQVTLTRGRPSRSVEVRLTRATPPARPVPATRPAPSAPSAAGAPAARTGSLLIESRPTAANIVLNGRLIGTTPMTIDDLEPGTYTVQLQLATFRPITTTVRVVAGARARAAASLVSAQEPQ